MSWRNNIRSKVSAPNQLEVYQTLCVMESELDEAVFTTLIKSFVEQWETKEPTFVTYFQEYYCSRTGMYILYVALSRHTYCTVLTKLYNKVLLVVATDLPYTHTARVVDPGTQLFMYFAMFI